MKYVPKSNANKSPCFFTFAFDEYIDKNNRAFSESQSLDYLQKTLINLIKDTKIDGQYLFPGTMTHIPWFGGFFVYDKYSILSSSRRTENGNWNVILSIDGHTKTDKKINSGDNTFVSLITRLLWLCDIPYNKGTIIVDDLIFPENIIRDERKIYNTQLKQYGEL